MPGRGQYWKEGGLNDGVVKIEDLESTAQTQHLLSFLLASSSATQALATDTKINIDSIDASRGSNISLNTGTSQFTLKANKTYKLTGNGVVINGDSLTGVDFQWFDVTNTQIIGSVQSNLSNNPVTNGNGVITTIVTPSTDITMEFRMGVIVGGTLGVTSGGRTLLPHVLIEEI